MNRLIRFVLYLVSFTFIGCSGGDDDKDCNKYTETCIDFSSLNLKKYRKSDCLKIPNPNYDAYNCENISSSNYTPLPSSSYNSSQVNLYSPAGSSVVGPITAAKLIDTQEFDIVGNYIKSVERHAAYAIEDGDFHLANKILSDAVSLYPNNKSLINMYGVTLAALGDYDGAYAEFQRSLSLDESYEAAMHNAQALVE